METCGMSCIKYFLFVFNIIFALSGLGIIVAGALVLADISDYSYFLSGDLVGPSVVLIVAGAIVFVVAFLGCFGAIRESYKLLIAFAVLLLIIFILELAVGIAAAVYKVDYHEVVKSDMRESLSHYSNHEDNGDVKIYWDKLQKKLECCGVDDSKDWQNQEIPLSCCTDTKPDQQDQQDPDPYCVSKGVGPYMFKAGCYEKMKVKIESNVRILIGVGIGIAFIQLVGIVLAFCLAYTIKKEQTAK